MCHNVSTLQEAHSRIPDISWRGIYPVAPSRTEWKVFGAFFWGIWSREWWSLETLEDGSGTLWGKFRGHCGGNLGTLWGKFRCIVGKFRGRILGHHFLPRQHLPHTVFFRLKTNQSCTEIFWRYWCSQFAMKRTNRLGRIQVPIKVIKISDIRQIPEREKNLCTSQRGCACVADRTIICTGGPIQKPDLDMLLFLFCFVFRFTCVAFNPQT